MEDLYKILELNRDCSTEDIKKSYRRLSKKYHPDVNSGSTDSEEKFKQISEAYSILSDPSKKEEYDTYGTIGGNNGSPFGGHDFNDIFSRFGDFFGFGQAQSQRSARGNDLRLKVQLTLQDIIKGVNKKLKYIRQVKCNICDGLGGKDFTNCGICQGTGQRKIIQKTPFGTIQQVTTCNSCNGQGKVPRNNCNNCRSQGVVPKEETVDVHIPKGVVSGNVLNMGGFGNYIRNGYPGDLHILIEEVPDKDFKRENTNLIFDQNITIIDAILGSETQINTPHGLVNFVISPGTSHGKTLRIHNLGIPDVNTGRMGDLIIRVSIKIPQSLTTKEREILLSLKDSQNFN